MPANDSGRLSFFGSAWLLVQSTPSVTCRKQRSLCPGHVTGQLCVPLEKRLLSVDQRQALELLLGDSDRATEELLTLTHGFDSDMIAGLIRSGLATARRESLKVVSGRSTPRPAP